MFLVHQLPSPRDVASPTLLKTGWEIETLLFLSLFLPPSLSLSFSLSRSLAITHTHTLTHIADAEDAASADEREGGASAQRHASEASEASGPLADPLADLVGGSSGDSSDDDGCVPCPH